MKFHLSIARKYTVLLERLESQFSRAFAHGLRVLRRKSEQMRRSKTVWCQLTLLATDLLYRPFFTSLTYFYTGSWSTHCRAKALAALDGLPTFSTHIF